MEEKDKDRQPREEKLQAGAENVREPRSAHDAGDGGKETSAPAPQDEPARSDDKRAARRSWLAPGSVRFVIMFIVFVAAVFIVYNRLEETAAMAKYMSMLATQVAAVVRFVARGTVVLIKDKAIVTYNDFSTQIIPACGAVPSMSIFTAAVLAFPTRISHKLLAILLGLPLLYVVNVGRLACLSLIGGHCPVQVFRFAHIYVWQTLYIVFVVMIWFVWISYVTSDKGFGHFVLHIWQTSRLGFALRFVCFGLLFLALFTIVLPLYSYVMVHVSGFCLQVLTWLDVRGVAVDGAYGIRDFALKTVFIEKVLNINMAFQVGETVKRMYSAQLAFTLPPFLALVAASSGTTWRRRLASAGIGVGVLLTWQLLIVIVYFVVQVGLGATQGNHFLRVIGFMNAVLPFLMWFVMLVAPQIPGWPSHFSRKEGVSGDETGELCDETGGDGIAAGGCSDRS